MLSILAAADPCKLTINWGSVPDWVAGVGTAAAFLFAFFVWRQDLRARAKERHEREAERRDAEAAAARLVTTTTSATATTAPAGLGITVVAGIGVSVRNYNHSPILDVAVSVHGLSHRLDVRRYPDVPANGKLRASWEDLGLMGIAYPRHNASAQPFEAEITFTDVAGLRWRRRGNAQPVRVLTYGDPADVSEG